MSHAAALWIPASAGMTGSEQSMYGVTARPDDHARHRRFVIPAEANRHPPLRRPVIPAQANRHPREGGDPVQNRSDNARCFVSSPRRRGSRRTAKHRSNAHGVIPAQAGIQFEPCRRSLDSRLRPGEGTATVWPLIGRETRIAVESSLQVWYKTLLFQSTWIGRLPALSLPKNGVNDDSNGALRKTGQRG